jgi:regulator of sigma E protease
VTTLLAFAFVIGVLVFVHELGHFLAARRIGVRVLKFSLGFGPRLVGFTRGDTEYCISIIPLGGYVKMAGENVDDPRSGQPDEFLSKTKWERFQVLIMGPLMNIALAIVLLAVVLMNGADVPKYLDEAPVVGKIEKASPAERAGFEQGDRLLTVAGDAVQTWEDVDVAIGSRANRELEVAVLRSGSTQVLRVTPDAHGTYEVGRIGIYPDVHPHVRSVISGEPAERAGIKPGDVVLAVDEEPIVFAKQLSDAITKAPGQSLVLTIQREGQTLQIPVTPEKKGSQGMIGVSIANEVKRVQPGPAGAVWMSVERNWEFSGLILKTLWGLLTGETSPRQLMGPVGIAQLSGESAQEGWVSLFSLMASISLNLGLLNLLPIPVLDGGHILIMLLEGVARRDFSTRVKEKMLLAGFVLLMLLMVTVIYNDLTRIRWVENLMFWR